MSSYIVGTDQMKPRSNQAGRIGAIAIGLTLSLVVGIASQLDFKVGRVEAQEVYISPMAKLKISNTYSVEKALTPVQQQDWEGMKLMARRMAPIYSYPVKVVIAQMALESGRGTSHCCTTRNNCFGIAAYDHNPDAAWTFETKEQGMIEYFRLIRDNFPEAWAQRGNPERMIELLKDNSYGVMYATDPDYLSKLRSLPEWRED